MKGTITVEGDAPRPEHADTDTDADPEHRSRAAAPRPRRPAAATPSSRRVRSLAPEGAAPRRARALHAVGAGDRDGPRQARGQQGASSPSASRPRAGTRSVTLRSKRLKKGRYTVEIQARDAYGNRLAAGHEAADAAAGERAPWRPPADAWSRRDFMRNGFASVALLCTLPIAGLAAAARGSSPPPPCARRRGRRSSRSGATCRGSPSSQPVRRTRTQRHLRRHDPGGHGRGPARLRDADLRLRRRLPGPDDPRPHGPRGRRPPAQHGSPSSPTCTCTAAPCPPGHDGHPMDVIPPGAELRVPLPQRPGRGHALVPRPRARAHVAHALLRAGRDVRARGRPRARARPAGAATTTCRSCIADHAFNRDGSFRYVENIDVGFRGDTILVNGAVSPRMRVRAAQVPAAASSTRRTRARTPCGSGAAGG